MTEIFNSLMPNKSTMELSLYMSNRSIAESIYLFKELYYSSQLRYLASDLLEEGLSPQQISDAVKKAIKIISSAGIVVQKHFMPVYSSINHQIIMDCKLSHFGYGLVMMNADPNLSVVGNFQVSVLRELFEIDMTNL